MIKKSSIAILVYGEMGSGRNALTEEKYRELADALINDGYEVKSVSYNDDQATGLAENLASFDAVLVWINPIEQGHGREKLDKLLVELASKGCLVSTHPEVILKMGTKEILYTTRHMDWGGDTRIYTNFETFTRLFPESLNSYKTRVLKQYRGNGGNGVFKIISQPDGLVKVIHAISGNDSRTITLDRFFDEFKPFFGHRGLLIDQEWNSNIANGMVRCYISGTKVAGFGYQEINALYEPRGRDEYIPPGKRYYFTENCGLFSDLREHMEQDWIPELQAKLFIDDNKMPLIWDADFFINNPNGPCFAGKYTLCEINVSCVSPFPPSAIKYMVEGLGKRLSQP